MEWQAQFRTIPSRIAHKKITGGEASPGLVRHSLACYWFGVRHPMNHLLFVARRELKGLFCNFKSTLGQEQNVDIAEVARRSGVPASTLRFYDEKGLIASIGRRGLH